MVFRLPPGCSVDLTFAQSVHRWARGVAGAVEPLHIGEAAAPHLVAHQLRLIAGPDPDANPRAALIHQDARMYATVLDPGQSLDHAMAAGRHAWVHCATGNATVNGLAFKEGDGASVSEERQLTLRGEGPQGAEILLFDLA